MKRLVNLVAAIALAAVGLSDVGYGQRYGAVLENFEVEGAKCQSYSYWWVNAVRDLDFSETYFQISFGFFDVHGSGHSEVCVLRFNINSIPGYRAYVSDFSQDGFANLARGVVAETKTSFSFQEPDAMHFSNEGAGPGEVELDYRRVLTSTGRQGPASIKSGCSGETDLAVTSTISLRHINQDEEPDVDDISMAEAHGNIFLLRWEPCQ